MTLNQPVWSLSAEVVGYAAFPLLAWQLMHLGRSAAFVALGSFAAMFLARETFHQAYANQLETGGALMRLAGCFIGGAAFWRLRTLVPESWSRFAGPIAVLSVAAIATCSMYYRLVEALPVLYGILILALSYRRGIVDRILSTRIAVALGAVSFSLYLIHVTVVYWIRANLFARGQCSTVDLLVLAVSGSLLAATILHLLVEKPLQETTRRRRALARVARGQGVG